MKGRWLVYSTLVFGVACPPPVLCPGGTSAPVRVALSEDGSPFTSGAAVSYSVDDGTVRECTEMPEEGEHVYGCGTDQEGEYSITAVVQGREDVTATTTVVFEDCRLQGQTLDLSVGELCAVDFAPSVVVTVLDDATGDPLEDAVVKYRMGTDSGGMKNCDEADTSHQFNCGDNEEGSVRIAVLKAGYTGREELVDVSMGTCHVNTENMEVRLSANE